MLKLSDLVARHRREMPGAGALGLISQLILKRVAARVRQKAWICALADHCRLLVLLPGSKRVRRAGTEAQPREVPSPRSSLQCKLANSERTLSRETLIAFLVLASSLASGTCAAAPTSAAAAPISDNQRIDYLIRPNQLLVEEIQRPRGECERPKMKEEAFATCMQAAKGQNSPMAAESIGGHCDERLKK
jgi:hypothetical protein